jgi:cyanate lyase
VDRLPAYSKVLFDAKTAKELSFADIGLHIGRSEVACAALFYGQAQATAEDVNKLSVLLNVPREVLAAQMMGFPDRGRAGPMPPVEPLIYRLYEIVQNYGYAFKAVLNEQLGDGIMSGVNFSTKIEKEVDDSGITFAVITLRGRWYVFSPLGGSPPVSTCFRILPTNIILGFLFLGSKALLERKGFDEISALWPEVSAPQRRLSL